MASGVAQHIPQLPRVRVSRARKNRQIQQTDCSGTDAKEHQQAIDIIKWTYSVAKLPADSPRFAYYVSRWDVPSKIEHAKQSGRFAEIMTKCPPIDPAWIRLVPAALEECSRFAESIKPPAKRASSPEKQTPRSHYLMAYLNSPVLPALTLMRSTPVPSAMRASTVSAISGNRVPLRM